MKIRRMTLTPVSVPFRVPEIWSMGKRRGVTNILVEVEADPGVIGIGEAVGWPRPAIAMEVLKSTEPLLAGQEFASIDGMMRDLRQRGGWHHFPNTGNAALAGLEIALWDLYGRSIGQPLHRLWGGPIQTEFQFMYFLPRRAPELMAGEASAAVKAGWRTIYFKVGTDRVTDVEAVRQVRTAIGDSARLRVDANEAWSPAQAIQILKQMAPYDLEFIEQPTPRLDITALKEVRQRSGVPVAANQSSWTNDETFEIIRQRAADVILTDPWQAGGLSAFRKIAGAAEIAGIPMVKHSFCEFGVGLAASMQVMASHANFNLAGQAYPAFLTEDVVQGGVPAFDRGTLPLPTSAGIGVDLDPTAVRKAKAHYEEHGEYSAFERHDRD